VKTSWLFETDTLDRGTSRMFEEVKRQGMEAKYASTVPDRFERTYLDLYPREACVVFCGSLGFAGQAQREAQWIPGVYNNRNSFLCSSYYPHFGDLLMAEHYTMLPFGDLLRRRKWLFEEFGQEDTIFLRPNTGFKLFTGKLVHQDTFKRDLDQLGCFYVDPGEIMVVSEPRNVEDEWRFVVVDHKLVASSSYRIAGEVVQEAGAPEAANDIALSIAGRPWQPDRAWVIDVCRTRSNNYYLVEINSFSCSGLYACEAEPVVREVSRVALQEWEEYQCGRES
jgi:hypothetical protein